MAPDEVISTHLEKLKGNPAREAAYIVHTLEGADRFKISEDMMLILCDRLRNIYTHSKPAQRNVEQLVGFYARIAEKTEHEDIRRGAGTGVEMLAHLSPTGKETVQRFYDGLAVKTGHSFYRAKSDHYASKHKTGHPSHPGEIAGIIIMLFGIVLFAKAFTGYAVADSIQSASAPLSIFVFLAGFIITYYFSK